MRLLSGYQFLAQEGDSVKDAVVKVPTAQPCIIVRGALDEMLLKKPLISTIPPKESLLVPVSAFYAYNMHYTEGCTNLYTFYQVIFFKSKKPLFLSKIFAYYC